MARVNRRRFLQVAGAASLSGVVSSTSSAALAHADDKPPVKYRLGIVTYNIAAQWDVPTILKVCRAVGLSPVELRTTHKHGVEPSIDKAERERVKARFEPLNYAPCRIPDFPQTCRHR